MATKTEQIDQVPETIDEAYGRFLANYLVLGGPGANMDWFKAHVKPLLAVAIPSLWQRPFDRPAQPAPAGRRRRWDRDAFIDYYSNPALDRASA